MFGFVCCRYDETTEGPNTHRVFDRHYSSDEGSGLGLAIVQHLVQAHGGTVQVRNRSTAPDMSTGAAFEIRLPGTV